MSKWTHGQAGTQASRQTDGQMGEWTDGLIGRQMDNQTIFISLDVHKDGAFRRGREQASSRRRRRHVDHRHRLRHLRRR
jgi:hypothetical protein